MLIVDPMHNLLLGTAKHAVTTWTNRKIIPAASFEEIQRCVDPIQVPIYIGRIPSKIQSGFYSFTADQWRNWTCIYSPVALKGILPEKDFQCWMLFVQACLLLCQKSISSVEVEKADILLTDFCCKQYVTICIFTCI